MLSSCAPEPVTTGNAHNAAFMEDYAVEHGSADFFETTLQKASVAIEQEKGPTAPTLQAPSSWINPYGSGSYRLETKASDPGIGVKTWHLASPSNRSWGGSFNVCEGGTHSTASGDETLTLVHGLGLQATGNLPDGEDTIESYVEDGVGLRSPVATAKVKIDARPPESIKLSGLPSNGEVSDAQSQLMLKALATDGSGSTPSSGVASIALSIDGRPVGSPSGGCSPGPCPASGEWPLNTEEYGAGKHTLTVTATDNAGNVASESFPVTIHHASPVAMGPGSVNPVTGEFGLSAGDVSIGAPGASLTLARAYSSRHLTAGAEGPLGPQWSITGGAGVQSITKTVTGSLLLTNVGGQQTVFVNSGGVYRPPSGDANLSLSEKPFEGATELLLSNGAAVSTFRHSSGGSANLWVPAISEGAGGTNATSYAYATVNGVTEPTEELAPVPAGVSCAPTLRKGCRALTFKYATATTASGESRSEWGSYQGRLEEVIFNAWEPKAGEMVAKPVARYEYDKEGPAAGRVEPADQARAEDDLRVRRRRPRHGDRVPRAPAVAVQLRHERRRHEARPATVDHTAGCINGFR